MQTIPTIPTIPTMQTMQTIPRTIFQTWKSKTIIPENMAYWQTTWRKHNPSYEFILWDDNDNRTFIETHYPWFLERYDSYQHMIQRADAVRYFYLYHYGGVYVDMDFECIKSFDDILQMENENDVILGRMGDAEKYQHEHNIPNAIMISKPRETFWICAFFCLLKANPADHRAEYTTGPVILKETVEIYNEIIDRGLDITKLQWYDALVDILLPDTKPEQLQMSRIKVLDGDYFYPLNWRDWEQQVSMRHPVIEKNEIYNPEKVATLFPNSYAVTYWTHSY